jgi:hypothetical protein
MRESRTFRVCNFTNDCVVPELGHPLEAAGVEQAPESASPILCSDDDTVDVDEPIEPVTEPKKMPSIVVV